VTGLLITHVLCITIALWPATSALGGDNDSRQLAWLYDRLKAPEPSTRAAAAKDLGALRPVYRGALLQLIHCLSDQDADVRAAVQEALASLTTVKEFEKAAEGLSRPPRVISLPRPVYPAAALAAHLEGTVHIEFLVRPDGSVTRVNVLRSVPGLDDAAVAAAEKFVFAPAVKNGRLVETIARAPVNFRVGAPHADPWPASSEEP
jgi:TonB family protein